MRSRYLWWEAENSGLFWMKYRVGKDIKKVVLLKSGDSVIMFEIVLGILCPTWKGDKPFSTRLLHFCYSLLVKASLLCVSYFPKLNLLPEEWVNNCSEVSSFSVVFSVSFSSSDICRNCLYSQRIAGSEWTWSSRCLTGEWTIVELVILPSFSKALPVPFSS